MPANGDIQGAERIRTAVSVKPSVCSGNGYPITVTTHAVDRALRRRLYDSPLVEELIEQDVRAALGSGRRANHKPKPFRLYREKAKGSIPEGQVFVWSGDGRRGFILARDGEGWVVVTSLSRAEAA